LEISPTPCGGGISADVICGEKIRKGEEKKGENAGQKGRKGKEKGKVKRRKNKRSKR
jgi:hypothetical protein